MITKNFKSLMALMLMSNSTSNGHKGQFAVKNVANNTYYLANVFNNTACFPYAVTTGFTMTANNTGISVGNGSAAATEDDYQLQSTITNGLSVLINLSCGSDNNGNPYLQFDIMLTNVSGSSITVSEIGYKQNLRCSDALNGTSYNNRTCLLDRTVLANPVTIDAGEYAVIRYTLKTIISSGE